MNKFEQVSIIAGDLAFKLRLVLGTITGWVTAFMAFMLATFGDKAMHIHWVLLVLFIDLLFGSWSAIKRDVFHISTALFSTACKVVMYITIFFMPMILENILGTDLSYGTVSVTALLISAEFFSILAHMLIIKPDLVGVKLFKRLLSGEIAKKLGITVKELEDVIK